MIVALIHVRTNFVSEHMAIGRNVSRVSQVRYYCTTA